MIDFDRAVTIVLDAEGNGALTNDVYDPGGETKYGIAKASHPTVDIAALTREAAIAIYRVEYWGACGCDLLPWPWALAVFDCAVNQGAGVASALAQHALDVTVDGHIGPLTVKAAFAAVPRALADFFALRCMLYAKSRNADRYEHGWFVRAFVIHGEAVAA